MFGIAIRVKKSLDYFLHIYFLSLGACNVFMTVSHFKFFGVEI